MTTIPFTSYAQNMEDIRLWRALRHVRSGRYIDIGAWDPRIDTLRPWVIVVEATRPLSRIQTHHTFEHLLLGADYLPAGFDGLNRYYVAQEHKELVDPVSEPVSILDLIEGCSLSDSSSFLQNKAYELRCIKSSWSWKLTKPLRAIRDFFGGK